MPQNRLHSTGHDPKMFIKLQTLITQPLTTAVHTYGTGYWSDGWLSCAQSIRHQLRVPYFWVCNTAWDCVSSRLFWVQILKEVTFFRPPPKYQCQVLHNHFLNIFRVLKRYTSLLLCRQVSLCPKSPETCFEYHCTRCYSCNTQTVCTSLAVVT